MNDKNTEKSATAYAVQSDYLDVPEEETLPERSYKFARDYIIKILEDHLLEGKDGMTESEITLAYIHILKTEEKYEYEYKDKQPTVNKALKRLLELKRIERFGKVYRLVHQINRADIIKNKIFQEIRFEDGKVFRISRSTVVVRPTNDNIYKAKEYLGNYLGSKCYGIIVQDGYLIIMLLGKGEKLDKIRADVINLVEEAYQQNNKK